MAAFRHASTVLRLLLIIALVAGTEAALWFYFPVTREMHALIGLALVGLSLFILFVGRVKLFGPVLFADAMRTARRGRHVILRCLLLLVLMIVLLGLYLNQFQGLSGFLEPGALSAEEMARFAENFFLLLTAVQIVAVVALTPAYTAGSITEEREKQTLDFLLASSLQNQEIVLGKLMSRLGSIALLILTGLPLLSLLQLMGGVDPDLVLAALAVTALTAMSLGCVGVMLSVFVQKSLSAMLMTYLLAAAYLVVTATLYLTGPLPTPWDEIVSSGNLLVMYWKLDPTVAGNGLLLPGMVGMLLDFAIFHLTLIVISLLLAVLPLRAWYKAVASRRLRRAYVVSLSQRRKRLPLVGGNAMLWKEMHAEPAFRFNRTLMVIVSTFMTIALVLGSSVLICILVLAFSLPQDRPGQMVNAAIRVQGTLVATFLLIGVGLRAAGSLGGERDRQTWDGLLSAPFANREILWAKWLGSVAGGRKLWWYLGIVWLVGVIAGGVFPVAPPAMVTAFFIHAAFLASLGMWLSLTCRTTQRAITLTILAMLGLAIGPWLVGVFFDIFLAIFDASMIRWLLQNLEMWVIGLWVVYPMMPAGLALVMLLTKTKGRKWGFWSPLSVFLIGLAPPLLLTLLIVFAVMMGSDNTGNRGSIAVRDMFNSALSPPANIWFWTFYQGDWKDDYYYDDFFEEEMKEHIWLKMAASATGLACYALAAFALWEATCRRFPIQTGRMPVVPPRVPIRGKPSGGWG